MTWKTPSIHHKGKLSVSICGLLLYIQPNLQEWRAFFPPTLSRSDRKDLLEMFQKQVSHGGTLEEHIPTLPLLSPQAGK